MRVLIVDNFDSFTHNLAQLAGGLGAQVLVRRNTASVAELLALAPERVILSPGPGGPAGTGSCLALLRAVAGRVPVLGVCLGMQLVATAHGGVVGPAPRPVHGEASLVRHDGRGVFLGLPSPLTVGRYHSLAILPGTLPPALMPTAHSEDGVIMGLRHAALAVEGVQFHPESVLTPHGDGLMANFLAGTPRQRAR